MDSLNHYLAAIQLQEPISFRQLLAAYDPRFAPYTIFSVTVYFYCHCFASLAMIKCNDHESERVHYDETDKVVLFNIQDCTVCRCYPGREYRNVITHEKYPKAG